MPLQIFVARDGQQFGPYSEQDAQQFMDSGNLVPEDLAWHEGLPEWTPLGDLLATVIPGPALATATLPAPSLPAPTLAPPQAAMPKVFRPPGAPAVSRSTRLQDDADTPRPWRRYFARHLDYLIGMLFLGVGVAMTGNNEWLQETNDFVVTILVVYGWTIVEPISLALTGTTPGKLLLGLWVARQGGGRPGFFQALGRSWAVLAMGMGLYIPIVILVTNITSYNRLKNDGRTSWDESRNLVVLSPERAWWKWLLIWLGTFLVLAILFVIAVGIVVMREGALEQEP